MVLWSYSQEMRPYDLEMQAKHAEKKVMIPPTASITLRTSLLELLILTTSTTFSFWILKMEMPLILDQLLKTY